MMKIAISIVTGISGRPQVLLRWPAEQAAPSVVCLQELKGQLQNFLEPRSAPH